jgi:hypothetical protein
MKKMKNLTGFRGQADKVQGQGSIVYCLWVDEQGELYVQFQENDVQTSAPGSFTGLLYSVSKYAGSRNSNDAIPAPEGYDLNAKAWKVAEGRNHPGFLKAVLRDLLP